LSLLIKRVTTSSRKAKENSSDSQPAPDASLNQDPESTWLADSKNQFWKWTRKVGNTKLRLPALFFWILKVHLLALVLTLAHVSKSLPALCSPGLQLRTHQTCLATVALPPQQASHLQAKPQKVEDKPHQLMLETPLCASHKSRPSPSSN
jgi:hypothetical protein